MLVAKMTRCLSLSPLGSEFDTFLFAPIGEDGNGMLLSVVSVLARLGIDPWLEAAKLARLPEEAATERLASFIAALPKEQAAHSDPEAAARLIALLPRVTPFGAPSSEKEVGTGASPSLRGVVIMLFLSVAMVALVVGAQGIASNHQQSMRVDTPPSDASGSAPAEHMRH